MSSIKVNPGETLGARVSDIVNDGYAVTLKDNIV